MRTLGETFSACQNIKKSIVTKSKKIEFYVKSATPWNFMVMQTAEMSQCVHATVSLALA